MDSLKARFEAFQRTKPGMFMRKVLDDQVPNLAALLAWGTLSALLPLMLGILGLAGLVLTNPEHLDRVYSTLLSVLPADAASALGPALQSVRQSAGVASILALVLLLFNGSSFFANMGSVFDQAYHVEGRNFLLQRLVAILMLLITTALLVVSTVALGIGSLADNLELGLPIGPTLGLVISWSISILSVVALFVLLYKVLPNAAYGWRDVLPGTLLSAVLFFLILQIFPIYLAFFPPNQAYAVFGVFLVFTFWLYLLGFVFVLGAELNAFLLEPARSTALAEAAQKAHRGKATYDEESGHVEAEASGSAPAQSGGGILGSPKRSPREQHEEQGDQGSGRGAEQRGSRPTLAGRVLGFVGLIFAVMMLRGRESS